MLPETTPNSVPFRQENPLRQLVQVAVQVQAGARELIGYELLLGDENLSYVNSGAESMFESVSNLLRSSTSLDDQNPLLSQDIRHDLRNQVAVVKGFSDLMLMDLPNAHPVQVLLQRLTQGARDFVEILDTIKQSVESGEEPLPIAS